MPGLKVPKSTLKGFHTPVLYIIGGRTDVAYANAMEDFLLIDHVPVVMAYLPVGHGGTYHEPNGGAAAQVALRAVHRPEMDAREEELPSALSGPVPARD